MSAIFNAVKATSLPASPAVHTLYYIKGGSDVRVKGYVTDATGTAFPLGIIDEQDVLGVMLDGFTVGTNAPINSSNTIFTSFRNIQAQLNTLSTAVAGGIKIPLPIDCSTNPNYPAAAAGDSYLVTVGGRIGGASGELVQAGDKIIAQQTNAGGNQATVGTAWYIINGNIDIATTEIAGVTRIATSVEVDAGTDNFAYVTPTTLRGGVRNTPLTGYAVGANTAISATDSILGAFAKVQGQLNNKETSFSKNTGFNKNFGSIAGTVAQGNDTRFHNPVTLGTANGLSLVAQALSLALASTSATGALSSTDWNTFNSKQNALTDPVTGSGTAGQVSFWTGAGVQGGDSGLVWDNVNKRLGIGGITPTEKLQSWQGGLTALKTYSNTGPGAILVAYQSELSPFTKTTDLVAGSDATSPSQIRFITRTVGQVNLDERWRITPTGIFQCNGAQTIQTSGTEALTLQGNGGNTILNPSGGNVGIGVTPVSTTVFKTIQIGGSTVLAGRDSSILGADLFCNAYFDGAFKALNNGGATRFNNNPIDGFLFSIAPSVTQGSNLIFNEVLRINPAGNVGIGTTAPDEKLHVAGKILVGTRTEAPGKFATYSTAGVLQEQTVAQVRATVVTWTLTEW